MWGIGREKNSQEQDIEKGNSMEYVQNYTDLV